MHRHVLWLFMGVFAIGSVGYASEPGNCNTRNCRVVAARFELKATPDRCSVKNMSIDLFIPTVHRYRLTASNRTLSLYNLDVNHALFGGVYAIQPVCRLNETVWYIDDNKQLLTKVYTLSYEKPSGCFDFKGLFSCPVSVKPISTME